jgi:DNA topoisomerase-1
MHQAVAKRKCRLDHTKIDPVGRGKITTHVRPRAEVPEPVESAAAAGLHYVSDRRPGIHRVRAGKGFRYRTAEGRPVRDDATLARIKSLVIPPAWTDVWICPSPNGHLQATGIDARGRKQYRYHPRWRQVRDEAKYHRLIAFGRALPRIRARADQDLARVSLLRAKVLAAIVRLLEATLIRVGNEEYARANGSFGLTTMRDRHVRFRGGTVHFAFRGKSGVRHDVDVHDRRLARIVKKCQDIPGQELFQYLDDQGERHTVTSTDVNDYLHEIAGEEFTAKDFRTLAGTVLAARALQEFEAFDSQTQAKRNVVQAIEDVALRLGNTRAVCRKCYIHPAVLDAYLDGSLLQTLSRRIEKEISEKLGDLRPEEAAVLAFLQERLKREAAQQGRGDGVIAG